ncbi:MAG: glycosyltransferase family 4 protein [Candidatus Omnitrophica bacterium]|nr:glycosyltransferase family 4 protein [Candidatus Omnitrophota bacterium]MCB9748231.1 glycosyltransferase family 4 protein [Candidatus Omnitrophota bacterium]
MKIVYILEYFPKLSETFILNEILCLQKMGHEIHVFAFEKPNEEKVHQESSNVRAVSYFPQRSLINKLYGHVCWIFKYPRKYMKIFWLAINRKNGLSGVFSRNLNDVTEIMKIKPRHIHAHFSGIASDMAMLISLLTDVPFTFTTHGSDIFFYPPDAANLKLKTRLAKKHITISEYNKNYLVKKFGLDQRGIEVIHCGLNLDKFRLQNSRATKNGIARIVCVARLERFKGVENLILTCKQLKEEGVPFKCHIIGKGRDTEKLNQLICDLHLTEEVQLLGSRTQTEVFQFVSEATMKILPSLSEGIPIVLMEAMALRVPVIATRVNGIPELITDEESGLLVEPNDVDGLANRIKFLLRDTELQKRITRKGYDTVVQKFNLNINVEKLYTLWKG